MRNTKIKIISAAGSVFNELGYIHPSIEKLSLAANVSKMTFYKYFPDKESLIIEVLNVRREIFIEDLRKITAGMTTPRMQLKGIFDYYAVWIASASFNGCMFSRAAVELGSSSSLIIKINDELKAEITKIISDVLKVLLEPEPAERLALTVMMLIDGAIAASLCPSMTNEYRVIDLAWIAAKSLILADNPMF
jgi:AcrR family transcriptional regulator